MESESQLPPSAVMIEGEAEHHPHKSVLKKVKDKAKKIKDTIKKHGHDHDRQEDYVEEDDDDQLGDDPELHGAPTENQIAPGVVEAPKIKIGLEEDPHYSSTAAQIPPSNYQSKVADPTGDGGKEANVAPLVSQFDNMNIHKEPEPEQSDSDSQEKLVKTEQHTPTQNTITDKISSAKNAVASKLGYGGGPHEGQDHSSEVVKGQQLSSGGTVKEYLAEKLRPGDEDKALSEVITEVFTWKRERSVVEGSRVKESEEVAARLGPVTEKKREGDDALKAGAESSGQGVVDRLKDAVGAWLGKGTGLQTAQESVEMSNPTSATNQVEKGEGASGRQRA